MSAPDAMGAAEADRLLRELGEALAIADPPPPVLGEAARAAFAWRSLDQELAQLVEDSAGNGTRAGGVLAGVRGTGARHLTFESPTAVRLDVRIDDVTGGLSGRAATPEPIEQVHLLTADGGRTETSIDARGRFSFTRPGSGPVAVEVVLGGRRVRTEWTLL